MPTTDVKARIDGLSPRIDALRCFAIRSMVAAPEDDTNRDLLRDILLGRTSNFINTDYLF